MSMYGYGDDQMATVGWDDPFSTGAPPPPPRPGMGPMPGRGPGPGMMPNRGPMGPMGPMGPGGPGMGPMDPRMSQLVAQIARGELQRLIPPWMLNSSIVPGAASDGQLMSPLGLGSGVLTSGDTTVTLTANPQRPFRPERLVITARPTSGAQFVIPRLSDLKIGENSQLVASQGLPIDAFAADAFGVRLLMSTSQPGVQITARIEVDAGSIPGGEAIYLSATLIGRAVWGTGGQQG